MPACTAADGQGVVHVLVLLSSLSSRCIVWRWTALRYNKELVSRLASSLPPASDHHTAACRSITPQPSASVSRSPCGRAARRRRCRTAGGSRSARAAGSRGARDGLGGERRSTPSAVETAARSSVKRAAGPTSSGTPPIQTVRSLSRGGSLMPVTRFQASGGRRPRARRRRTSATPCGARGSRRCRRRSRARRARARRRRRPPSRAPARRPACASTRTPPPLDGQIVSTPSTSSSVRSISTPSASTSTRPGRSIPSRTPPPERRVRSRSRCVARSHTAQNDWRPGPTRADPDAQHQLRPVDADVAPALERPRAAPRRHPHRRQRHAVERGRADDAEGASMGRELGRGGRTGGMRGAVCLLTG